MQYYIQKCSYTSIILLNFLLAFIHAVVLLSTTEVYAPRTHVAD